MATKYAYTYSQTDEAAVTAKRIPFWVEITEQFDGGAVIPVSTTNPVGKLIPAGTPITIAGNKLGGAVTLNGSTPTGLTKTDVIIGEMGAPVDIVTKGKCYINRTEATITSAQKTALSNRILMMED